MSSATKGARIVSDSRAGFCADSNGAIMVMGLLMGSILVAALWYVAGLGNAILFRERAQEAADATAFTAAAVHARGMNLIVFLNLTMAAILAVRVALKALLMVAILAEVVFALICLNPFGGEWACAALPLVGDAIAFTQDAITATREPINMALTSLSDAEKVIADVIPAAAVAASTEVGRKYTPTVRIAIAVPQPDAIKLPVEEGSTDYLCKEAGQALGDILGFILDKAGLGGLGAAAKWIGGRIGDIVDKAPGYFCELPGGAMPDHSAEFASTAKDHCTQLKQQADDADGGAKKFDQAKCEKDQKKDLQDKFNAKMGGAGGGSGANWSKMTPKKLVADFGNGCPGQENLGLASGNDKLIRKDPKLVALGHFGKGSTASLSITGLIGDIAGVVPDAFTQAEYFYDCHGMWGRGDCNADGEDAMWHFRWRPRVVMFDNTHQLFKAPAEILSKAFEAQMTIDVGLASANPLKLNAPLLLELEKASAQRGQVFIH